MAEKLAASEMMQSDEEQFSIEDAFRSLDEMIAKLQDKDISLDEAVKTYQKGMELCSKCAASIDLAEKKVILLSGEEDSLAF